MCGPPALMPSKSVAAFPLNIIDKIHGPPPAEYTYFFTNAV